MKFEKTIIVTFSLKEKTLTLFLPINNPKKKAIIHSKDTEALKIINIDCYFLNLKRFMANSNINEMNYFASLIHKLSDSDFKKLIKIVKYGDYTESIKDIINVILNLDKFKMIVGPTNTQDLGIYFSNESGTSINYSEIGRWIVNDTNGFFTDDGFISCKDNDYPEKYNGRVPNKYKLITIR